MALIQRLPHDPDAVDISTIQRREVLRIWRRQRALAARELRPAWWKGLLPQFR